MTEETRVLLREIVGSVRTVARWERTCEMLGGRGRSCDSCSILVRSAGRWGIGALMVVAVPGVRSAEGTLRDCATDTGREAGAPVAGRLGGARLGGRERTGTLGVIPTRASCVVEGAREAIVDADEARRVGGAAEPGRGSNPCVRREGGREGGFGGGRG